MVPWDPPWVLRVPILGPNRGIFSKLDGPGPLRPGGYSYTSFSIGRFHAQWNSFGGDVNTLQNLQHFCLNKSTFSNFRSLAPFNRHFNQIHAVWCMGHKNLELQKYEMRLTVIRICLESDQDLPQKS